MRRGRKWGEDNEGKKIWEDKEGEEKGIEECVVVNG